MKTFTLLLLIFFQSLALAAPSGRTFMRWTDDKGTIHFTDDLNKIPSDFRNKAEPINMSRYANPKSNSCRFSFQPGLDKVVISGKINDGVSAKFLIDPTAQQSVISKKFAESLGFKLDDASLKKIELVTSNEKISAPLVKVDRVDLQGCETINMYFAVSDLAESPDYVGILAQEFFKKFLSTIDIPGGKITLQELKK
jgi:hypothetical protein